MLGDIDIAGLVVWYIVFVFSTTFHEFSHAFLAYKGGDLTAYEGGTMSLDPTPHIKRSPFGMVLIPLISFVQMGWMIGWASVPFDPEWGRRHPKRQAYMSLAGPAANFLLALVALGVLRVLLAADVFVTPHSVSFSKMVALPPGVEITSAVGALAMALSVMLNLNVLLGVFNLMPLPPLDGAGVVEGLAPRSVGGFYAKLRETPLFMLGGLIVAWQIFGYIATPLFSLTLALLHPGVTYR